MSHTTTAEWEKQFKSKFAMSKKWFGGRYIKEATTVEDLVKFIDSLLSAQATELLDEVEKVKIAPHLPPGMRPNLDEEIWNNAIDRVLSQLRTKYRKDS